MHRMRPCYRIICEELMRRQMTIHDLAALCVYDAEYTRMVASGMHVRHKARRRIESALGISVWGSKETRQNNKNGGSDDEST